MRSYKKENGIMPQTDFKKGDIVVLEKRAGIKNIIVLDSIEYGTHFDIWCKAWMYFSDVRGLVYRQEPDGIVCHNGDVLRDATTEECAELIEALLMQHPKGSFDLSKDKEIK